MSIASLRAQVIAEIWSGAGMPTAGADVVATGISNPLSVGNTPSNLLRTDRYTYTCRDNSNATITVPSHFDGTVFNYVWRPTSPNGRLIVCTFGHGADINASYDAGQMIKQLVESGFTVTGHLMPGANSYVDNHNALPARTAQLNCLRIFIESQIRVLNHLAGQFSSVYAFGISGGGWTTCLFAAVDTRVSRSYHNAGVTPIYTNEGKDWEQHLPGLATFLDYQDLCLLGCDSGRRQRQTRNVFDTCCFTEANYYALNTVPYTGHLINRATSLGCDWSIRWDPTAAHEYSAATMADIAAFFA